ncbi:hypothetical protein QCA50_003189 [Cerrena zonata]|uniref:t-SNARE coiled-coil homology domain-containing protein n=1 Tax=Cerrena zonata TaxID=2478898 RepID=A0AAW0GRD8_9APHY
MARDRLAALRAQRQQQGDTPQTHEMTNLQTPDYITQPGNGAGNGGDPMSAFYSEISSLQDTISQYSANVSRIGDLQSRSLNSTDESQNRHNAGVLDDLVSQTRDLGNGIKQRIQSLDARPAQPGENLAIRKNQIALVRNKFVEALQGYQGVERDYRARYKQRVERQFRIVKPDATAEEINAVVNDTSGGGDQIFAQALTSSTRYGESRAAYREVQDRHEDIRKIERTLEELAQLFNDVSVLVQQQDDSINVIETTAGKVEADTEAGLQQTEKAVKSARAARRKRWICFILLLVIIAILALVLGLKFGLKNN